MASLEWVVMVEMSMPVAVPRVPTGWHPVAVLEQLKPATRRNGLVPERSALVSWFTLVS
jgi:hypothetical protein